MSDYFYENMVAKMVSSNGYQEGYSIGFASGHNQGKADGVREFVEWCKMKGYSCYDWRMLIEEYEKEQKL